MNQIYCNGATVSGPASGILTRTGPRAESQKRIYGRVYAFCARCGQPLAPCPAGGDAAVMYGPRYIGFYSCCHGAGVIYETAQT